MQSASSLVEKAEAFARQAHEGQMYGQRPYIEHCAEVVQLVNSYHPGDAVRLATAWLHDVLEDTTTTREQLLEQFGPEVEFAVEQMTGRGGNRKARNADIYSKLRFSRVAILVKLCDRIANVQESWRTQDARLFMYHREHHEFAAALRPAVYSDPAAERALWHLYTLLGHPHAPRATR